MLILMRAVGEEIVIGEDIIVKVARVVRHRVKLLIEAPADVRIERADAPASRPGVRRADDTCGSEGPSVSQGDGEQR